MAVTLDLKACATLLNASPCTVMTLAKAGALRGAKIGRSWIFLEEDVMEFLRCQVDEQVDKRKAAYEAWELFMRGRQTIPIARRGRRREWPRSE